MPEENAATRRRQELLWEKVKELDPGAHASLHADELPDFLDEHLDNTRNIEKVARRIVQLHALSQKHRVKVGLGEIRKTALNPLQTESAALRAMQAAIRRKKQLTRLGPIHPSLSVIDALAGLTEKQYNALMLTAAGHSTEEIMRKLGEKESTVRMARTTGLDVVRNQIIQKLHDEGLSEPTSNKPIEWMLAWLHANGQTQHMIEFIRDRRLGLRAHEIKKAEAATRGEESKNASERAIRGIVGARIKEYLNDRGIIRPVAHLGSHIAYAAIHHPFHEE